MRPMYVPGAPSPESHETVANIVVDLPTSAAPAAIICRL